MNIYYHRTTNRTFHVLRFVRIKKGGRVTYSPRIDYDGESEAWVSAILGKGAEEIAREVLSHYGEKPKASHALPFYVGE